MTTLNLMNLFGIKPANNAVLNTPVNFRGSESVNAFFYGVQEGNNDRFTTNAISVAADKASILKYAKSSPRIMALLKEYNIPLQVNMEAI